MNWKTAAKLLLAHLYTHGGGWDSESLIGTSLRENNAFTKALAWFIKRGYARRIDGNLTITSKGRRYVEKKRLLERW